jgi:hypothetical protein
MPWPRVVSINIAFSVHQLPLETAILLLVGEWAPGVLAQSLSDSSCFGQ